MTVDNRHVHANKIIIIMYFILYRLNAGEGYMVLKDSRLDIFQPAATVR